MCSACDVKWKPVIRIGRIYSAYCYGFTRRHFQTLYSNVMVTGGNSLLLGFVERLNHDLAHKCPPVRECLHFWAVSSSLNERELCTEPMNFHASRSGVNVSGWACSFASRQPRVFKSSSILFHSSFFFRPSNCECRQRRRPWKESLERGSEAQFSLVW